MKEGGSALFWRRVNVERREGEADGEKKPVIQTTKGKSGGEGKGGFHTMATEDSTGGARKATKSKLFEFLVHGVVSEPA